MKLVGQHHQVAQGIYPYHPYPFSRFIFVSERFEELSISAFTVSGFDGLRKETCLYIFAFQVLSMTNRQSSHS